MKNLIFFFSLLAVSVLFTRCTHSAPSGPPPTQIKAGEEESDREARNAWIESMHRAAPGTDWRQIEYRNRMQRHRRRAASGPQRSNCGLESLADGQITGQWKERGSINQAGSVFDTEYDPETNDLWLISAGGSLFRGNLLDPSWQVVNQDLRFNPGLLRFIERDTGRRLVAFAGRLPHYSDDEGLTWTAGSGLLHTDRWGNIHRPVMLEDSLSTIYVMSKLDYWSPVRLFRSTDQAESFLPVDPMDSHDFNRYDMFRPHGYPEAMLTIKNESNKAELYETVPDGPPVLLNEGSLFSFGNAPANIAGSTKGDSLFLYAYSKQPGMAWQVHRSTDYGLNWELRGDLPIRPWDAGLFVDPDNPEILYMGEVECFRSLDGGQNWEKINNWYDYYDDIEGSLHADMMHFDAFKMADGTPFLLISNHGGLSVSYDNLETAENIGLSTLNVSQYYSVATDPLDPRFVYAGSQDQGFQRCGQFDNQDIAFFEQVISGDFGHIAFSHGGENLWTVYPGGWVTMYTNPRQGTLTATYDINSEQESVWLPPVVSGPDSYEGGVYMAGGSIEGGTGSHLVKLSWQGGEIVPSQSDFDFYDASGGALSAIGASAANQEYWYGATTNGRFFYSRDGGDSWEQSVNFIPDGHYLYGQAILTSKFNPERVLLGGSGYSGPAVFLSTDGGENFTAMSQGLPNTLVFGLASNEAETMYFAATESGPYVYFVEEGRWYDLAGQCAPAQTYWSVEYLEEQKVARFGTYGRGIWDFEIETTVNDEQPAFADIAVQIGPNPTRGPLWIHLPEGSWEMQLVNSGGQIVRTWQGQSGHLQLQLSAAPGLYFLQLSQNGVLQATRPVVIQ